MSSRKLLPPITLDTARRIIDRALEGARASKIVRPDELRVKELVDDMIARYDARLFIHSMANFTVWEKRYLAVLKSATSLRRKLLALQDDGPLHYFYIQSVLYSVEPAAQTEAIDYMNEIADHILVLETHTAAALDAVSAEKGNGDKRWYEMTYSPETWLMEDAIPKLYITIFNQDYTSSDSLDSPSQLFTAIILEVMKATRSPTTVRDHVKAGRKKRRSSAPPKA